ncbi:MAG TPA: thiamine diphosphokinase [Anaerolineaceae bacterium]
MPGKRALIFANGPQINLQAVRALIRPDDYRIAADGGLQHLRRLGLQPDLLIGDLDSVEPGEVEALKASHVRVEQYPVQKDETDLELALLAALREGCTRLLILGALGGRLDMTLANIFLLGLPELMDVEARLEDGREEIFLVRPADDAEAGGVIDGQPGDTVSLLPLDGPAGGIRTSGLYYPLRGETLYPERTRGVSNQMVDSQARVTLETGRLICIHTRRSDEILEERTI